MIRRRNGGRSPQRAKYPHGVFFLQSFFFCALRNQKKKRCRGVSLVLGLFCSFLSRKEPKEIAEKAFFTPCKKFSLSNRENSLGSLRGAAFAHFLEIFQCLRKSSHGVYYAVFDSFVSVDDRSYVGSKLIGAEHKLTYGIGVCF